MHGHVSDEPAIESGWNAVALNTWALELICPSAEWMEREKQSCRPSPFFCLPCIVSESCYSFHCWQSVKCVSALSVSYVPFLCFMTATTRKETQWLLLFTSFLCLSFFKLFHLYYGFYALYLFPSALDRSIFQCPWFYLTLLPYDYLTLYKVYIFVPSVV